MDVNNDDVLSALLIEERFLAKGEYKGKIVSQELRSTSMKCRPFYSLGVQVGRRKILVLVFPGNRSMYTIMQYAAPGLIGARVKVRVNHRQHDDRVYMDNEIMEFLE